MKDILLIMSDQHGQAYTQMEDGRIRTPHMKQIAEEGLSFSHCYCNAPLCVPSRMSFLSGKMPGELQIFGNDTTLPIDMPTIAHAMGIRGYHTVLAGRMHFKGDDQKHGFDERLVGDITSQYWGTGGKQRTDFGAYTGTSNRKHCLDAVGGGYSPVMVYDEAVFQAAMECLRGEREEPLFLVVGFYGPHFPFACESSLYRYYKGILGEEELTELDCEDEYREYRQTFTLEKARNCKAAYFGQVETLDRYVGTLYDLFRKRGGEQLFIYTSDHGEQLGKHGIFGKQTLYQESVRVPLLVAGTGVGRGARGEQVSLLDVSKTLLAQAGADGAWHQGRAISLKKKEEKRPPVVIQQMLDLGGELALAEAVIRVPYKAVKIGDRVRIYRLGKNGGEDLCTAGGIRGSSGAGDAGLSECREASEEDQADWKEGLQFFDETAAIFTDHSKAGEYITNEQKLRKQHDILKQWGMAKKPPEPARMPIPERGRDMPME